MAREHSNIRLDIWGDDDWRKLTRDAQWLYELLLTHPKTNRAGVCEWKPGRLAMMAAGTEPGHILNAAAELIRGWFIVVDDVTEEVVIRSYVKHDGVLKQPNMTTTMANDWAGLASPLIRSVIAFELQKYRDMFPTLPAWANKRVRTILDSEGVDAKALPIDLPKALPIGYAIAEPIGLGSRTSTSTSTEASLLPGGAKKKPETRLPGDWVPTSAHFDRATASGVDITKEVTNFRLHAETHDRHAANWNAAFTTWLTKAKPSAPAARNRDAWMNQ